MVLFRRKSKDPEIMIIEDAFDTLKNKLKVANDNLRAEYQLSGGRYSPQVEENHEAMVGAAKREFREIVLRWFKKY